MRRSMAITAAATTIVLTGSAGAIGPPAQAESAPGRAPRLSPKEVTLLTGDVVTVVNGPGGAAQIDVKAGPGRDKVRFATVRRDGQLTVLPSDAEPLIAKGKLDDRLFNVTQLIDWGYDDKRSTAIPVIMKADSDRRIDGIKTARAMDKLGMSAMRIPKDKAATAWRDIAGPRTLSSGIDRVWLDGKVKASLDESAAQIGAPTAWKRGYNGRGVKVAVLDTGYDRNHPDIEDAVATSRNFTGESSVQDGHGHGTHVASIIAGSGAGSEGRYRGVAHGAKLAVGKVLDAGGSGTESQVMRGMAWAATDADAKIVNMSLGMPDGPGLDPVEEAVNRLTEETGTLFVVAAGNDGPDAGTLNSPGSADAALTVGAVDKADKLARFSSRGPRQDDNAIKPDITAPGVSIVAARAEGTSMGEPVDDNYTGAGGTSMATPHVAGAAAILAQRRRSLSAEQLKAVLMNTARPAEGVGVHGQGAGRADIARAVGQRVRSDTGSLSEFLEWPHGPKQKVTRTITYRNDSVLPVMLTLSPRLTGTDGRPAPRKLVTVNRSRLILPPFGSRKVEVTIKGDVAPGEYTGALTATSLGGRVTLRTVLGVTVDTERYKVTVDTIDRTGGPARTSARIDFNNLETGEWLQTVTNQGSAVVRLPPGTWHVQAPIITPDDEPLHVTIAATTLTVDREQRLTLDARQAKHLKVDVGEPDAKHRGHWILYKFRAGDDDVSYGYIGYHWDEPDAAKEMPYVLPIRRPGLTFFHQSVWVKKDAEPTPYAYHVVRSNPDGVPDDPSVRVNKDEMAKVRTTYRSGNTSIPWLSYSATGPLIPGLETATPQFHFPTPAQIDQYVTPGHSWSRSMLAPYPGPTGGSVLIAPVRRLDIGDDLEEVWNGAVIGPSLQDPEAVATRDGDDFLYMTNDYLIDSTPGRWGGAHAEGKVVLSQGDREIAGAPYDRFLQLRAALPADDDTYTLRVSADRSDLFPDTATGNEVETEWTFRSARTSGKAALPLLAVRLAPRELDPMNRAKAGTTTEIPIWIEGTPSGRELTSIEASFDEGDTWQEIPIRAEGDGWLAAVDNPDSGYVSLRAKATADGGNAVTHTFLRAYAVDG